MIINNIGYNHIHDSDFNIERPNGTADNLMLLLRTDAVFILNGKETVVQAGSFIVYKKDTPQYYRCISQCVFSNDWIHFLFEDDEESEFLELGLNYEIPIKLKNSQFISYCIKSIANEVYSSNLNKQSSIRCYMLLIFNKVSEQLCSIPADEFDSNYEILSTVRSRMYSSPYEKRTVESTAHEVSMSVSNFQHLYKKYFNITYVQDLINSRIEYSKMLLRTTNLNVSDIAQQSGYNHYSHFVRQFHKSTGMTPADYRNTRETKT